jgi:pimeloyl-ACP methyl ester carboxylesterase
VVEPFPTEVGHPRVVQFIHRRSFNPLPYWSRVQVPVFAVWGGQDIRVPGNLSYERLSALFEKTSPAKNHELALYERSGHAIEDPETGRLSEDLIDRLFRWLKRSL